VSPDDEVARGEINWNVYDFSNTYETNHTHMISGKDGSASVNYVVMSNAAQALVQVILINGDGENPTDFYGNITAGNVFGEIELFRNGKKNTSKYDRKRLSLY
jgi:hypothetical protein